MSENIHKWIMIVVLLLLVFIAYGQGPPPDPDNNIPLDPFSWIILATGGAIGAKKYFDQRKGKS